MTWYRDRYWWVVGGLILLRAVMVTAAYDGFPPTEHVGWLFEAGGDEETYLQLGYALAHGWLERSIFTLGYQLILVPCIWLTNASSVADVAALVVWIQAYGVAGLCILGIAWLGWRLSGKRSVGLVAAGIWTILPYLIWGALVWLRQIYPELRRGYDPGRQLASLLGVHVIGDTLSVTLVIATLWMCCRAADSRSTARFGLAGLLAGWALLTRPANLALVALGLILALGRRRWAGGLAFAAAAAIMVLPQLWCNRLVEGSAFRWYLVEYERWYLAGALQAGALRYPYPTAFGAANVGYFGQWLLERLPAGVLALLGAGALTVPMALARLARCGRSWEAALLGGWIAAYASVLLPYYAFPISLIRYLMPVYPALCIAVVVMMMGSHDPASRA